MLNNCDLCDDDLFIRLQKTKIGIKSFKRKRGFRENFMVAV